MNQRRVSNHLVGSKKKALCFSLCYSLNDIDPVTAKLRKDLEEFNDLTFPRKISRP